MTSPISFLTVQFRSLLALSLLGTVPILAVHGQTTQAVQAQAAPANQIQPLLANLTFPMDISRLHVGTKFQARATQPWTYGACTLSPTNLVEGHVSQVEKRSKTSRRSAFDLVIDSAECGRHRGTPIKLTLIALIGPFGTPPPNGEAGVGETPPLTALPLPIGGGAGAAGGGVPGGGSSGFRSVESASFINGWAIDRRLPSQWKIGMVVDVPMNLAVGTGVDGGSIIWATDKDARLEGQTTFILLPTPEPAPKPATPATAPPATP